MSRNKDKLKDPLFVNKDYTYLRITDDPCESKVWTQKYCELNRYACREYKIRAAKFFPEFDYSIWHDGSLRQKSDLRHLIEIVEDADIASYLHTHRNDLNEEMLMCIKLNKYFPKTLRKQVRDYQSKGCFNGLLFETGVLVRKHNMNMLEFGEMWWNELLKYSIRDQISFPYVLWKTGTQCKIIPGNVYNNDFFNFTSHCDQSLEYTVEKIPLV